MVVGTARIAPGPFSSGDRGPLFKKTARAYLTVNVVSRLARHEVVWGVAAVATYRAACLRWPKAKITPRQSARVVVRIWRNGK